MVAARDRKIDEILKRVSKKIRPTKEEKQRLQKVQNEIENRLIRVLPRNVLIGTFGSVSKKTNLRGNDEIDVFILFPRSYTPKRMQDIGIKYAIKATKGLKTEKNYAQHPYLKAYLEGVKIDIVPSYTMENEQKIKSAVDRSQLHVKWVSKRMDAKKQDDVRLLKQFLKNIGAYGAQLRVEGFSGYLCELLIIRYGSFCSCIKNVSGWKEDTVIDIQKYYEQKIAKQLFSEAGLVVIDPVDRNRNVAAVVSRTSISRFIHACREFIRNPTEEHFFRQKEVHSKQKLKIIMNMRGTSSIVIMFKAPDLVEDVLWPQLRKTTLNTIEHLKKNGFGVFGHYYYADEQNALILIELMSREIPRIKNVVGPKVYDRENVEKFLKVHNKAQNLHYEHERIVAVEKRACNDAISLLRVWVKSPDGIAKGLVTEIKKAKIIDAKILLEKKNLIEVASDYYSRRI
jgi:tRNA nucleotidyltransferase (CCA-adding enzyme)